MWELGAESASVTLSGQRETPEGANRATGRHPLADDAPPGRNEPPVSNADLHWIANYIWGIADDVLRDLYVRGKYRDVILPMTVLRRLDAVLEGSKKAVLHMKATLDVAGVVEQDPALRQAAGQAFYNTSRFTLRDLRARANRQQLKADVEAYLDGFSPNVQDILDNFEFRNQIPRLSKADALGTLIEKLTSPDVNLSPAPVKNADGTVKHPGLDNHGMGSIFEELVRRFNEENNEEAGEHWTPRDAVRLIRNLTDLVREAPRSDDRTAAGRHADRVHGNAVAEGGQAAQHRDVRPVHPHLIVVDKLLTGFDAPPATYLYIDKPMQDHGLFQAICRVNRLDGEDKEYGYVIDYKDLFRSPDLPARANCRAMTARGHMPLATYRTPPAS